MAGKNDNFDALMAMMALKHIMDDAKDIEIHPFTCEVTVTPTSISCSSSGNKACKRHSWRSWREKDFQNHYPLHGRKTPGSAQTES